jgi:hypothetical protein
MRSDRGLTLIEILLSILVLLLGIMGIMALFPTALQTSRETVEERHAVNLAESVKHSIGNAMRFRISDGASPDFNKVVMTHDMDAGAGFPYLFWPPKLTGVNAPTEDGWRRHPSAAAGNAWGDGPLATPVPNPELSPQFKVSSDGWMNATVDYVRATNDQTEPYRQYMFNFDIAKVNTLAHLIGVDPDGAGPQPAYTVATLDPLIRLYEVRINVLRKKGGPSTLTGSRNSVPKNLILTVTHRVSLK